MVKLDFLRSRITVLKHIWYKMFSLIIYIWDLKNYYGCTWYTVVQVWLIAHTDFKLIDLYRVTSTEELTSRIILIYFQQAYEYIILLYPHVVFSCVENKPLSQNLGWEEGSEQILPSRFWPRQAQKSQLLSWNDIFTRKGHQNASGHHYYSIWNAIQCLVWGLSHSYWYDYDWLWFDCDYRRKSYYFFRKKSSW